MTWCLWCAEKIKWTRSRSQDIGQWVHQDGAVYKTYVGADGVERDDHCVLPTNDQEAAERMTVERRQLALDSSEEV